MHLVLGSSLIATITSIMTQYRLALEDSSKKFHQLQTFLSQQEIDTEPVVALDKDLRADRWRLVSVRSRAGERLCKAADH